MRVAKKLLHGVVPAVVAVLGARVGLLALGLSAPPLSGLVLRVGVPAFVVGLLFFPVSTAVVASRWSLTWRVLLAAMTVSVVNRLLVRGEFSDITLAEVPDRLRALVPSPAALDGNGQMMLLGVVGSVLAAWLAQPLFLSAVRPVASRR